MGKFVHIYLTSVTRTETKEKFGRSTIYIFPVSFHVGISREDIVQI